ncbi:histidine kinase dimerization/phospho-acceptor domain-containing protein [Nocardioides jishulii]|uniref:histidine kinase n=1 Tax=Nocardioides jishulii TaxID=2575440 RepID=A0A4U2YT02_9ACTN|nr:histidine kinase dimerization/phospho-acceptor domain-containing protein [Nocardioides jishulii]QCX28499.1 HAMP domain-containing histidine kinase [Nocardioides jishulii]TKI64608.1 HAMP domain-containing histidine kinase [Nocardioides jishulii]
MRERLVIAFVGMTVAMIAMYGIPRAYVLADLVNDQEELKVERSSLLLAALVDERVRGKDEVDEAFLSDFVLERGSITYVAADGTEVQVGDTGSPDGNLTRTRELDDGGTLTLTRSEKIVSERISQALLPLVTTGLGLMVFAAIGGFFIARRLARPFRELAGAAEQLADAKFDVDLPRYSIPEAEAISSALRLASSQLDDLLRMEREFAANASHQLRTPITALRLTLEDLTMWPETPPAVADELNANIGELDRLSASINELLELSRGKRLGEAVDLDLNRLASESVQRWRSKVEETGRALVHSPTGPVPAHVTPGPVLQILDVLIENALCHGEGRITVGARQRGQYLDVLVVDEGPTRVDEAVFQRGTRSDSSDGQGLGLTIASQLATAAGGRLSVADAETTTFVLSLPAPQP